MTQQLFELHSWPRAIVHIDGDAFFTSCEEIALQMKKEIERNLGITVSVGLSITKALAKVASKYQKPSGMTVIKARRYALAPQKIAGFLKKNNFDTSGSEAVLSRPCPLEFSGIIRDLFESCYHPQVLYRATGVILLALTPDTNIQYTLFDNPVQTQKIKELYNVADELGQKFGKHTLHLGSTHLIEKIGRGSPTVREQIILKGETRRRHLALPLIHVKTKD